MLMLQDATSYKSAKIGTSLSQLQQLGDCATKTCAKVGFTKCDGAHKHQTTMLVSISRDLPKDNLSEAHAILSLAMILPLKFQPRY